MPGDGDTRLRMGTGAGGAAWAGRGSAGMRLRAAQMAPRAAVRTCLAHPDPVYVVKRFITMTNRFIFLQLLRQGHVKEDRSTGGGAVEDPRSTDGAPAFPRMMETSIRVFIFLLSGFKRPMRPSRALAPFRRGRAGQGAGRRTASSRFAPLAVDFRPFAPCVPSAAGARCGPARRRRAARGPHPPRSTRRGAAPLAEALYLRCSGATLSLMTRCGFKTRSTGSAAGFARRRIMRPTAWWDSSATFCSIEVSEGSNSASAALLS